MTDKGNRGASGAKLQPKVGWMDSVSFDYELGHALNGEKIYASEEDLRKHSTCIDTDGYSTVKRVYIFDADKFDAEERQ